MNNISSIVVKAVSDDLVAKICEQISATKGCEIVAFEGCKIVATIESDDLDGEISAFKKIEKLHGVADVTMIYSYDDLNDEIYKADHNDIEKIVQKIDESDIDDIAYSGDIKKMLKV